MTERRLTALADAVTDGERVDWRGAAARLTSSRSRALAAQLRTLAEIGRAGGAPASIDQRITLLRLPLLLRLVSGLAAIVAVTGVLGIASGAVLEGRDLLRLWIVVAFSLTGLLLTWGAANRGAAALGGAYWAIAASFAVYGTGKLLRMLPHGSLVPILDALRPEAFLAAFFWQFVRNFRWSPVSAASIVPAPSCLAPASFSALDCSSSTWCRRSSMSPGSPISFNGSTRFAIKAAGSGGWYSAPPCPRSPCSRCVRAPRRRTSAGACGRSCAVSRSASGRSSPRCSRKWRFRRSPER